MLRKSLMAKQHIKMYQSLGFDEQHAQLLTMTGLNIPVEELKEEIQAENELVAEETSNFVPFHQTLDDFNNENIYNNVKDSNSSINKNPVYKNVKPKMGKMTIDKETGERRIIH